MDNVRTGQLIARLRRERGLTQQELADALGLSNKAVSKWESGAGSPDISNLPPLADALGVSVDELLRGERAAPEAVTETVPESAPSERASAEDPSSKKLERAIIALAASLGAILGILAYNLGWLG